MEFPPEALPDSSPSLRDGPEVELRVKGSRFLAQAFEIHDLQAADTALTAIRKRHHDATHHCHGLRLLPPHAPVERCDDDGEPSGTSGPPILAALQGSKLYDGLVVVTRYFGGTKLGKGGLVRAYGDAAREALSQAPRHVLWHDLVLTVDCVWDDLGAVEAEIARAQRSVQKVERSFDPNPRLQIQIRRSAADALARALVESTGGRVRPSAS